MKDRRPFQFSCANLHFAILDSDCLTMSDNSDPESQIKRDEAGDHLEVIRTISRVPDNPNYYEKNGLRTEGDGMDHAHYNPVRCLQWQSWHIADTPAEIGWLHNDSHGLRIWVVRFPDHSSTLPHPRNHHCQ